LEFVVLTAIIILYIDTQQDAYNKEIFTKSSFPDALPLRSGKPIRGTSSFGFQLGIFKLSEILDVYIFQLNIKLSL
jgi:hypothetical protein